MVSSSDTLVAVSDLILNSIDDLNKVEYNKKGRKYRFVNNTFQRIREEDKHLIIYPENLELNLSVISSYFILCNINGGEILSRFPDFCLAIIGVAQQLEVNQWYEEENSSVIHYKNSKYNPMAVKDMAMDYATGQHKIEERHIAMGLNLMMCAKLNFLHTDHHIGTKLEGYYMKHFINEYFGAEALADPDVLVALKSFVHWGNIKGILYKLEVPDVKTSPELIANFTKFPDPMEELKLSVYDRYPSGTSKYSLIRKSIDILGDWKYSKLVPYPTFVAEDDDSAAANPPQSPVVSQEVSEQTLASPLLINGAPGSPVPAAAAPVSKYDLNWLYELCHNIEKNPIKYHLRSSTKSLCDDPINLTELSNKYSANIKSLLTLISLIINIFKDTGGEFLLQNSKIPKLTDDLIAKNRKYYNKLVKIQEAVESYEDKGWDADDIVLRLNNGDTANNQSFFDTVMAMREKYIDDYE